ncbi:hypothetical protein [Streptomyces sp. H27-H5]|uniref:hypothetical protein n=1 Tax=Streptomyces sp. H27-H5 TaxID=2996460 RepID=UPI00226D4D26|nr:hypothetical protein [Streptomyces sp. H27-H5]MCY0961089.1 hypothetical protein [Streptomyces sp. H27-H5]
MTNDRRTDFGTPTPATPRGQSERTPAAPADPTTSLLAVGGMAPMALLLMRHGRGHRRDRGHLR